MDDADFRVVEEYRSLVQLYRDYPKDMCVQMILRDYASCENDLDLLRCQYFEMLKDSCDDFPYGKTAELKRRMFTRSGEPVAVRLAQDLYSIISVTEGEDHSILKGMISSSRKGNKTSVVSSRRGRLGSRTQSTAASNQETCACSKELLLLKDTISTLQTNVLNIKQTMCMSDKLRSEQSAVHKSATYDLKQSVLACSSSIAEFTGNTLAVIRSISNSLMQQLMAMEDRVRYLEAVIETQQIQAPIYSAHPVSSTIPEMDVTDVPEEADSCVTVDNVVLVQDANDVISNTQNFRPCALPEVDHVEEAAPIPVRVTTRTDTHLELDAANEWNDIPSRRRTKRFCVLGYNRCVDTVVTHE